MAAPVRRSSGGVRRSFYFPGYSRLDLGGVAVQIGGFTMLSLLVMIAVLCVAMLALLLVMAFRRRDDGIDRVLELRFGAVTESLRRVEQTFQDASAQARKEAGENAAALREELSRRLEAHHLAAGARADEARREAQAQIEAVRQNVESRLRESAEMAETRITRLRAELTEQLDKVRQTLDQRIVELQTQNAAKLDEMRQTVDQRLQATLEQRLGESFKIVSESLERVTRSLGEMQQIASGVGDLKRVLTNVKTRGTWSEVQLSALLEQVLTPEQYAANIAPNPASAERVEFALKLPGRDKPDQPVWLPIDAKFPVEDYHRLVEAADRADAQAVLEAGNALELRIRTSARDISTKYVAPPYTTDFGILYLPTEGLYAEALRRPGLAETLQREHRIVVAGPTTLAALLNSLQMGFRTLAIQQRSSEVWTVLAAVKTEFGKFAEILSKVKKKLDEASSQIDQTGVRSRAIERRLRSVETLPAEEAARLLPGLDTEPPADEPSA